MLVASASRDDESVTINDVPGESYARILAALPKQVLRHTYDDGQLALPAMIYDVPWDAYEEILSALEDCYFRHTYDRGTLEIMMSPRKDHDWIKKLIGRMIESMCLALNIRIQSTGSTTLKSGKAIRGLEPDEGYYIANEARVRGRKLFDPLKDPPPDLALEVDVTSKSLKRLPVYFDLGVREVWRYDGQAMYFYVRKRTGGYKEVSRSLAFPFLETTDVSRFLEDVESRDENAIVRAFVRRARALEKKHRQEG